MKKETATAAKSKTIFIRRASPEDARILSAMGEMTFTRSYASIIVAPELASYASRAFSIEQIESELAAPQITYFVALAGTIPCGYSKLAPTPAPSAVEGVKPVELARLYVLPERTGTGIGTELLKTSLDAAVEQDYHSCWLRVWEGNEEAIAFYRRWGFRQIGSEPYHVGRCSRNVLLMIRDLARRSQAND
jgi:ribosomal protein S18 acetylase RimI-like enzyme